AEGDGFQREDRFARLVHRLNRFLETFGGHHRTEMAVGVDDDAYACCHGRPTNAGDKRMRVSSFCANAHVIGLASFTFIANVDIVTARGEIDSGRIAYRDVAASRCVTGERKPTAGRVVAAGGITKERKIATGRVVVASV